MMKRLFILAFCVFFTTSAKAADEMNCAQVSIPAQLELVCSIESDDDGSFLVITTADPTYSALNRISIRALDEEPEEPWLFLRERMTVDTSPLVNLLKGFLENENSPFFGSQMPEMLQGLSEYVQGMGQVPLSACEEGEAGTSKLARLTCRYGVGEVGQYVDSWVLEKDGLSYIVDLRAANDKRRRHLEAVANSFQHVT